MAIQPSLFDGVDKGKENQPFHLYMGDALGGLRINESVDEFITPLPILAPGEKLRDAHAPPRKGGVMRRGRHGDNISLFGRARYLYVARLHAGCGT